MPIGQPSETWTIRKPAVESRDGVVATQHRVASDAGAAVLAEGGNAVDAAIAASLALATVEPWMSGLGGGGYMLVSDAKDGRVFAISFGMVAPQALDPADYPLTGEDGADMFGWPAVVEDRNIRGPLAIAVPGQVAGLALAHERFATKRWDDLVAPALDSAERGLTVDWYTTLAIAASAAELAHDAGAAAIYLPDGHTPAGPWSGPAPRLRLNRLAETLSRLAQAGPRDFYEGQIGRAIAADSAALGGRLAEADLASYQAEIAEVAPATYRAAEVWTAPGLTAGPTLLAALNRLSITPSPGGTPDAETYRAYANALREAYAERFSSMGDQDSTDQPSCTSHVSVADGQGNVVALTQTLLSPFGSKVVLPDTGILMNNGIMWFDPRPGGPNAIAPGKRPLSNMCPTILGLSNGLRIALGASGGRRILPSVMQLLSFIADLGMDLDAAAHCPRINVSGTDLVEADAALDPSILGTLDAAFDLSVETHGVYPAMFACPNAVSWDPARQSAAGVAYVMSPNAGVSPA